MALPSWAMQLPTGANGTGGLVATNALTAAASGPEVNVLATTLNMGVQWVKEFDWFDQKIWAIPLLVVLGLAIGWALWHDELQRAVIRGLNISGQAWANYRSLSPAPIMPPAGVAPWTGPAPSSSPPSPLPASGFSPSPAGPAVDKG